MVSEGERAVTLPVLAGGRFRAVAVLGRGAQGLTYLAEDRERGGHVAIKCFQVKGAPSWKHVELAEREAQVLASLSHPNVPGYVAHFEEGGALYLVMERVEGKTLAELSREGVLGQADVIEFLKSSAATLAYLHGRAPPIIHRDIKPKNVIRRPDGAFVLVDFGAVRDSLRAEGGSTVVGTFGYMAPEQFQGRAVPASDLYGVGATALSCLTGQEPEDLQHKGLGIDVKAVLGGHFDSRLVALLARLVAPEPDQRPRDLAAELAALHGPDTESPPEPESEPEQVNDPPLTRRELRRINRELKAERKLRQQAQREAARTRASPPKSSIVFSIELSGMVLVGIVGLATLLAVAPWVAYAFLAALPVTLIWVKLQQVADRSRRARVRVADGDADDELPPEDSESELEEVPPDKKTTRWQ